MFLVPDTWVVFLSERQLDVGNRLRRILASLGLRPLLYAQSHQLAIYTPLCHCRSISCVLDSSEYCRNPTHRPRLGSSPRFGDRADRDRVEQMHAKKAAALVRFHT